MAHYSFSITAPANTDEDSQTEVELLMSKGVIHDVEITIPHGHAGLAHLKIFHHEVQLYPLSRNNDYHGDGMAIKFKDFYELKNEPYSLIARAYNTDELYDHEFIISIGVLPKWVVLPQLFTQGVSSVINKIKCITIDEVD